MNDYEDRLEFAYELRGLRPVTRRAYTRYVRQLSKHHEGRAPAELTTEDVAAFLEHLSRTRALAPKTLGVCYSALAFYYRHVERRPEVMSPIPRRKQTRSVPEILSVSEVKQLFAVIHSPCMRAVSMVMYGSGLRVSEACALRMDDIDTKRDVLRVREGKGGHDRYALLGERLLGELRDYWRRCRPPGPLMFPNRNDPTRPMTREAVGNHLAKASKRAGLSKHVSPHTLRHCFATHMIESGAELRTVQVLLGHSSITSTARYIRIGISSLQKAEGPLQRIDPKPKRSS